MTRRSSILKIAGASVVAAGCAILIGRLLNSRRAADNENSAPTPAQSGENQALIFVKPHAQQGTVPQFVEAELKAAGLRVIRFGTLPGAQIDEKGVIDAHYSAIGTYAMKMHPKDLPVSREKKSEFEAAFSVSFDTAAASGQILNTAQALEKFGWSNSQLGAAYEKAKSQKPAFKLGPGCYVAWIEEMNVFLVNGFYASMRAEYVAPRAVVTWYVVSWPEAQMSWGDFRNNVLGATNPTAAAPTSIRAKLMMQSEALGLGFKPDTGKNCVHGSASPLEAFNERRIWAGATTSSDPFGMRLLSSGVTADQIDWMCSNPTVEGKPLFDQVEDTNTSECLKKLVEVAKKA